MVELGGASLPPGTSFLFQGERLTADCPTANECPDRSAPFFPENTRVPCQGENCQRIPLTVTTGTEGDTVDLQIVARWEVQDDAYRNPPEYIGAEHLHIAVGIGPPGAEPEEVTLFPAGKYGAVGYLEGVPAGDHELVAVAQWGEGTFELTLLVPDESGATALEGDLLPDLVVGPPRQVRVEAPLAGQATPALSAAGADGCGPDELLDEEARRCLRFASDIGNIGVGMLDLILPKEEATMARATGGAAWIQHIHTAQGEVRQETVSPAEYHPTHGHYHIQAFAQTFLYEHDPATGKRGDLIAEGGKTGFCVVDGGPLLTTRAGIGNPLFNGGGCCYYVAFCELDTVMVDAFRMGLAAGWFDIYPWWRSGQYIDIGGVPDGTYELMTVVNPEGNILELDPGNNAGGVVLELVGDDVEVLSSWTQTQGGAYPEA